MLVRARVATRPTDQSTDSVERLSQPSQYSDSYVRTDGLTENLQTSQPSLTFRNVHAHTPDPSTSATHR